MNNGIHNSIPVGEIRQLEVGELLAQTENHHPYLMSYGFDLGALKTSIQAMGIVNPPILRRNEAGRLEIVTGYKRLMAARESGLREIICRVFSHTELPPEPSLLLAFHDNLATRCFNIIEKGLILKHLSKFYSPEKILEDFMEKLGLPKRWETYELYLRFERELSHPIKEVLARGKIQVKTAELLLNIDSNTRDILASYGIQLNLNSNQLHQFIDIMIDLMHITNNDIESLLKTQEIASILNCENSNLPQKANALLNAIRALRYPNITRTQKRMRQRFGSIGIPKGTKIIIPPNLEGVNYKLEIIFRDGASLKQKLLQIASSPVLNDIRPVLDEAIDRSD